MASTHDVELTKNALVAKLAELNKLSGEAITAALDHFKALDHTDAAGPALAHLTDALADTFKTLAGVFSALNGIGGDFDGADGDADTKSKRPRKKRAPKDPDAPKKPVTLFFLYRDDVREQLMKDNVSEDGIPMTNVEFTKLVLERWMNEPEDVKAKYKEEYTQKWLKYQKDMEAYKQKKALEAGEAVEEHDDVPEAVEVDEVATQVVEDDDDDELAEEPKPEPVVEVKEKKKKRKTEGKKADDKPKKKSKKKKSEKSD